MKKKIVNFKIESIDSMGQGVSKKEDKITFISKALIGDEGDAFVYKEGRNVQFAKVKSFSKKSSSHIAPSCEYYNKCGGCHYLHCSYEDEINFKKSSLEDIFINQHKITSMLDFEVIRASRRDSYRNRVQLHYDKRENILGFISVDNSSLVNISNCLVADEEIQLEILKLKKRNSWRDLVLNDREKGHIELYNLNKKVRINVNKKYAADGFTQVSSRMNSKMLELLNLKLESLSTEIRGVCFDLFGGDGNLSKLIQYKTYVIDSSPKKEGGFSSLQEYYQIDLYRKNYLEKLKQIHQDELFILILDPPRSGHKDIDSICHFYHPKHIIYISCNPQTLARDLKKIEGKYRIEYTYLMDFFPGTYHFEVMIFLSLKNI